MKIKLNIVAAIAFIFGLASPVLAQQGCYDSPEAPTYALMLIGFLGMAVVPQLLERAMARRRRGL